MAPRFDRLAVATLLFALTIAPTGRSQEQRPRRPVGDETPAYKVYSLAELGGAAEYGKWVADTIPEAIDPNTWRTQGGVGSIHYHPQTRVLIVTHTQSVQAKVEAFLKDLKLAAMQGKGQAAEQGATGVVPVSFRAVDAAPEKLPYPVPPSSKQPKHLFHFIIRYEGEGFIDSNVVEYFKLQAQQGEAKSCVPGATSVLPMNPGELATVGAAVGQLVNGVPSTAPQVAPGSGPAPAVLDTTLPAAPPTAVVPTARPPQVPITAAPGVIAGAGVGAVAGQVLDSAPASAPPGAGSTTYGPPAVAPAGTAPGTPATAPPSPQR